MKFFQVIITLSFLFSPNLYAQDTVQNSPVLSLCPGAFFNIGGYAPFTDETIVAGNLTMSLKHEKHEFYAGFIFPAMIPATQGFIYMRKSTIGASAGYRYYFFNPQHNSNLFILYEFQYIYFSGRVEEGSQTGYYNYETKYGYLRNIFGLGFSQYFDKKQNVGISIACGYMLPYEYYKRSGSQESYSASKKWGDPYMNNYFNFSLNVNIKLASLKTILR
jgi:hypothetical protein